MGVAPCDTCTCPHMPPINHVNSCTVELVGCFLCRNIPFHSKTNPIHLSYIEHTPTRHHRFSTSQILRIFRSSLFCRLNHLQDQIVRYEGTSCAVILSIFSPIFLHTLDVIFSQHLAEIERVIYIFIYIYWHKVAIDSLFLAHSSCV